MATAEARLKGSGLAEAQQNVCRQGRCLTPDRLKHDYLRMVRMVFVGGLFHAPRRACCWCDEDSVVLCCSQRECQAGERTKEASGCWI